MIVVRVRRMMGDHYIRLALQDGLLDMLNQPDVRHRVHLDIRELSLILLVYTNEL